MPSARDRTAELRADLLAALEHGEAAEATTSEPNDPEPESES